MSVEDSTTYHHSSGLGGEEFAVACDETTITGAATCAEPLRKAIVDAAIARTGNPPLDSMTISLGITTAEDDDTVTSIYQRADQALHVAKESGRDRVSTGT